LKARAVSFVKPALGDDLVESLVAYLQLR
jgi:hypothetical protein